MGPWGTNDPLEYPPPQWALLLGTLFHPQPWESPPCGAAGPTTWRGSSTMGWKERAIQDPPQRVDHSAPPSPPPTPLAEHSKRVWGLLVWGLRARTPSTCSPNGPSGTVMGRGKRPGPGPGPGPGPPPPPARQLYLESFQTVPLSGGRVHHHRHRLHQLLAQAAHLVPRHGEERVGKWELRAAGDTHTQAGGCGCLGQRGAGGAALHRVPATEGGSAQAPLGALMAAAP